MAVKLRNLSMVTSLLQHVAMVNVVTCFGSPFAHAVSAGNREMMTMLLEHGAFATDTLPIMNNALERQERPAFAMNDLLVQLPCPMPALLAAVRADNYDSVLFLLHEGSVDIDIRNQVCCFILFKI